MKKQLLTLLGAISASFLMAQSVPNGGFEQWQSFSYQNPQYYQSSNYSDENGSIVNGVNAQKTTQSYHGSYAAFLETILFNTPSGALDTAFGFIANGNPGGNSPGSNGIPYNQKPTGVRFYYEYYSAYSNNSGTATPDSGLAIFEFRKAGALIGQYIMQLLPTNSSPGYVLMNQTFSLSVTPDTVLVAFASSSNVINNGKGQPGSSLFIDSISFTGVTSQPAMLNGDMENWTSLNQDLIMGWHLAQNYARTTDKYSGNYAMQLTTMQPLMSDLNSGRVSSASSDGNGGPFGGVPYSNTKDTLVFYYKYYPANYPSSIDTASAWIILKGGTSQRYDLARTLTYSNVYKKVEIPFDLTSVFTPDTMIIGFQSSKNWPIQQSYNGSVLYIDEVYLKSQRIPIPFFGGFNPDGCVGDSIHLMDLSDNAPSSWQWFMTGAHPSSTSTQQNPEIVYTSPGTYSISLQACDSFGCSSFYTRTITIHALPQIQASSATICANSSATLTVSNTLLTADSAGASPYFWYDNTGVIANGVSTVLSPSATTVYTVSGTSQYGCENTAITSVTILQPPTPDICMVSVDSLSQYNIVYWDKTVYNNVDSFIVYRETSTNVYSRIGAVPYSAQSQLMDTARSVGGPNGGNPNGSSYRYKLQILDTCGNYSQKSLYHNTIYITNNGGGQFSWALPYTIESTSVTPVTNYVLSCDTANTNVWTAIQSVSGTQQTANDVGFNHHPNANWRVDATGFTCNVTQRINGTNSTQTIRQKSHSNTNRTASPTGIKNNSNQKIGIYPNPAKNEVNISLSGMNSKTLITIYDATGRVMLQQNGSSTGMQSIRLEGLQPGIYFVEANGLRQKLVISE